ncbi:MAG: CDP-alcohol phosphatidyltransferase [Prevotellaceae bacterium]|nr:CDP-alcohol phosphatidyltransferase [Prevotellaceae bacterium]
MNNTESALSKITKDRDRTNLLKKHEQNLIAFLVQHIPLWINSDMLTAIGLAGSFVTATSFILAKYIHPGILLFGILGFALNWFGDSLDGRLAYYRNKPRKWYGFSLDFTVDWLTNILIGLGYIVYVGGEWELLGFGFVVLYGWAMMTALLRYKIVDKYTIDSGILGPTEVRVIISLFLVIEIIWRGSIVYCGIIACIVLFTVNIMDSLKLLKIADSRDKEEKRAKNPE